MKTNKNVNYKARLYIDENGELHGVSFANQQIPIGLLDALNKAMHEVVDGFNGKTAWKETYIKFTHNGKRYEQFDGKNPNTPCDGCVFCDKHCQHPHYYDGSKGYCGKPYREVREEEKITKPETKEVDEYINDVRYYQTLTNEDNSIEAKELYDSSVNKLINAFSLASKRIVEFLNRKDIDMDTSYEKYLEERALLETYGHTSVITYEEWKKIKKE